MFRRGTSDISPGPGFIDNVQSHELPRFFRFVRRNGPDTGAILTQNVIPVISVQLILYQLPYEAIVFRAVFHELFLFIKPSPIGLQKRIPYDYCPTKVYESAGPSVVENCHRKPSKLILMTF